MAVVCAGNAHADQSSDNYVHKYGFLVCAMLDRDPVLTPQRFANIVGYIQRDGSLTEDEATTAVADSSSQWCPEHSLDVQKATSQR
ncbi:hypothetical protein [Mycobacterium timonense]|uniref:hypothetical protein n=1 Tax=Mycobacterium timonense TaxID=701043 RepID=UPI0013D48C4E|nr:hypothetical protein [Mycobacterium timonense]